MAEDYIGKYTGEEIDEILGSVSGKQPAIADLDAIRSGASAGAAAVQPAELEKYATIVALIAEAQRATGAESAISHRIDTIVQGRNVRDIVGNYAELEAYDTSTLGDNDIVMVLLDNTKSGHTTYYRWQQNEGAWEFIGGLAFTYTKTEIDEKFAALHIVLPTIPADAEAHPENYQELLAQVDTMVRGAGADASFKMPITDVGNVDVTYVKTNPANIYLGVFADDRSYLYHIVRTISTPRSYTCQIVVKSFADANVVITLPFVDDESTQATLKQAYGKVIANPNAVFRFDNGILATAFVDDLNQVNLQYREGNEVVQMVIADNVGTYVLARSIVELADAEELTTLQLKLREKAKVTPTLTSGTQIATITTENAEGQAVETPLYAPQGGGGGSEWNEVLLTEADYNADVEGFLMDAGEGKEFAEVKVLGHMSTDTPLDTTRDYFVGFGTHRNSISSIAYNPLKNTARYLAIYADATSFFIAQQNKQLVYSQGGTANNYQDSTQRSSFYIDCNITGAMGITRLVYWNYNNPRYFGIKGIWPRVTWARIKVYYRLRDKE